MPVPYLFVEICHLPISQDLSRPQIFIAIFIVMQFFGYQITTINIYQWKLIAINEMDNNVMKIFLISYQLANTYMYMYK